MCWPFSHKWGKWEITGAINYYYDDAHTKLDCAKLSLLRQCKKCGKLRTKTLTFNHTLTEIRQQQIYEVLNDQNSQ